MTNKERYQKTFSALHASPEVLEVQNMKHTKNLRIRLPKAAAVAACTVALMATTVCAADVATDGALRNYLHVIINGEGYDIEEVADNIYRFENNSNDIYITGDFTDREGNQVDLQDAGDISITTDEDKLEVTFQADDSVDSGSISTTITDTVTSDEDSAETESVEDSSAVPETN